MIYRVFSDMFTDERIKSSQNSWLKTEIQNIGVKNSDLNRDVEGLPYLKDLLDIGYNQCQNDDDIILYTNSDIGVVSDNVIFPNENFFSVRKNVNQMREYSSVELEKISYEHSINCDVFGITKKWYEKNRNNIPDFLIGSPAWDLCLILLLKAKRINNICYHVAHQSQWKLELNHPKHVANRQYFIKFCEENNIPFDKSSGRMLSKELVKYIATNFGYEYLLLPKYIIYSTPSHKDLLNLNLKSFSDIHKDRVIIHNIEDNNQYCSTAKYHESGWKHTQINKVNSLLNTLTKFNNDEIFIFCDADIVHLRDYIQDILIYLNDHDIVAQKSFSPKQSGSNYCSGFFAAKKNPRTIAFLSNILNSLIEDQYSERYADQYYFNIHSHLVNIKELDNLYFSPGLLSYGIPIENNLLPIILSIIPRNINIAHANWIKGKDEKLFFLKSILNEK